MKYKKIGIMCGSSEACDPKFLDMAYSLGENLGSFGHDVIYGGGARGLMRRVADGALSKGARVDGYMPSFMIAVEWQHNDLTHLHITKDMDERKKLMMDNSDATIFLPGGCGTMEEFFVWMCAKRLGHHTGPLVILNFDGYYDPLLKLLENMENEKFHASIHKEMYSVAYSIDDIPKVLEDAPKWESDAIHKAHVGSEKE